MDHLYDAPQATRPAVIISFPKRRGRPKLQRMSHDTGTPELVMKRATGDTMEALDLCLERGLITRQQHWCGIHLRWLYTLRYGAPSVRASDPTHLGGIEIKTDDPLWRAARELEYHEAINLLANSGHALLLLNLCIYNERPACLRRPKDAQWQEDKQAILVLHSLRDGLDTLAKLWKRGKPKSE